LWLLLLDDEATRIHRASPTAAQHPTVSVSSNGRHEHMQDYSDYLREQAAKYRELAEKAEDAFVKKEFLELADICEEVANDMDDRRVSG
jgi:hypothetical protein